MRFITAIYLFFAFPLLVSAQEKYSVVVGVEVYGSDFENLEFATEDATELGKALTKMGFTVKVMSSESKNSDLIPSNPDSILKIIRSMARNCDPKDTFVVSLSGHGIAFADDPVDENDERESYFCPQQAKLTDRTSLLPISKVLSIINECEASRKLVLIDACRDVRKVISKNGQKKGTAKKLDLGQVHQSRRTIPKGTLILFSCSDDQFSWQHDQLKHSVFTYHVIQYLRGSASPDSYSNGRASLDGLVSYVKRQTNRYVFNNNLSPDGQYPVSAGRSSNWILGKIEKSDAESNEPQKVGSEDTMQFVYKTNHAGAGAELIERPDNRILLKELFNPKAKRLINGSEVIIEEFADCQSGGPLKWAKIKVLNGPKKGQSGWTKTGNLTQTEKKTKKESPKASAKDSSKTKPKMDFRQSKWEGTVGKLPLRFDWSEEKKGSLSFFQFGKWFKLRANIKQSGSTLVIDGVEVVGGNREGIGPAVYRGKLGAQKIEGVWSRDDGSVSGSFTLRRVSDSVEIK